MFGCVGNSPCKNWGITGWGTFWNCAAYDTIRKQFHSGDTLVLVLDFDQKTLIYYKNNTFHGKFEGVEGHLYLTATMRQKNRITIVPTIAAITLQQLRAQDF